MNVSDIAKISTDNLYKFLATAGIIGIYLCFISASFIQKQLSEMNISTAELGVRKTVLSTKLSIVNAELAQAEKDLESGNISYEELLKRIDHTEQVLTEEAKIKAELENIEDDLRSIEFNNKYLKPYFWISAVTALMGIVLWNYKRQVPEDIILRKLADEAQE